MKQYISGLFIVAALANGCCDEHSRGHNAQAVASQEQEHEHEGEIIFSEMQAKAVGLETETVKSGTFSHVVRTGGQIRTPQGQEATVAATVSGIVSFDGASVTEGASIKAGQTVAVISSKEMADGDIQVKNKIEYETALNAFSRAEDLMTHQLISAREFEETRLRYETAKTVYNAQSARWSEDGVRLTAPISGYVKSRSAGQGEYVVAGQAIAVVTQNKRLQLRAEAPEKYVKALKNVAGAHFKLSYDERVYKLAEMNGRLLSVGQTLSSCFIPVTFEFDNIGEILPGAYCEVFLLMKAEEDVISVPVNAVTEEQGLYFVYLRTEKDVNMEDDHIKTIPQKHIYRKQEVQLGESDGERVQVKSGLQTGDEVVVRGAYQVKLAANAGVIPEGHNH